MPGAFDSQNPSGSATDLALCSTARLAAAVCRLPAVAVRDWCDRAAGTVANVAPGAVAVVLFLRLDQGWAVTEVEAAGVAMSPAPAGPRPDTLTSDADDARRIEQRAFLEAVRCAGSGLRRLGWVPHGELRSEGAAGLMSDFPGPEWTDDRLPHIWDLDRGRDLVCGLVAVGSVHSGSFLAVYVGALESPDGGACGVARWQAGVVGACLPLLGRAAEAALGGATNCKERWISRREQAVLEHLATGKSVAEIAAALGRSPHTIHDHIKSLHRKLPARTRSELLARALGLMPLSGVALQDRPVGEFPRARDASRAVSVACPPAGKSASNCAPD